MWSRSRMRKGISRRGIRVEVEARISSGWMHNKIKVEILRMVVGIRNPPPPTTETNRTLTNWRTVRITIFRGINWGRGAVRVIMLVVPPNPPSNSAYPTSAT